MKVPPKRTILIVIVKKIGTTGEDNPLKLTPLCSQYRNWTAPPMFGGYLRPCTVRLSVRLSVRLKFRHTLRLGFEKCGKTLCV